jgi:hypothetical protein
MWPRLSDNNADKGASVLLEIMKAGAKAKEEIESSETHLRTCS